MAKKRDPWMKLYPNDLRSDPAVKMCSRAARSVWVDLLGIMHESDPYGFLLIKGNAPTIGQLVSLLGDSKADIERWRRELGDNGVFSRVGDVDLADDLKALIPPDVPPGTIFSRRMVRDAAKAAKNRENGKGGGNPALLGDPPTGGVNRRLKAQKSEVRSQNSDDANASSGADAPQPVDLMPLWMVKVPDNDFAWTLFNPGLQWLASIYHEPPGKLRGVIGHWLKLARGEGTRAASPDDHRRVWDLLVKAHSEAIADPKSWMVVQLGGKKHDDADGGGPRETTVGSGGETAFQRAHREWREGGRQGPEPRPDAAPGEAA